MKHLFCWLFVFVVQMNDSSAVSKLWMRSVAKKLYGCCTEPKPATTTTVTFDRFLGGTKLVIDEDCQNDKLSKKEKKKLQQLTSKQKDDFIHLLVEKCFSDSSKAER